MLNDRIIQGFSKFNKQERIEFLIQTFNLQKELAEWLSVFEISDESLQKIIEELSENPVSNYHLPFSVAPNVVVNNKTMVFPLVTEESSVVAALAKAAGFWAKRGGFHAEVIGTKKKGQLHFQWPGDSLKLKQFFPEIKSFLLNECRPITSKMEERGGGIVSLELKDMSHDLYGYYQLDAGFETCDAMGANFINSCLEQFGKSLPQYFRNSEEFLSEEKDCEIIMAILSNYTPESLVRTWVECPVHELLDGQDEKACVTFAERFAKAVWIARADVSRAVTHNKGIFNGIDALAVATGNDFRAIEACGHAYASKEGTYSGLTDVQLSGGKFRFSMEIPLAVGVVGGVTAVHPLAKLALQLLENPSAKELMMYLAVAGLASNFSAIKALVSGGIQQGHMKMHLSNILTQLNVPEKIRPEIQNYFMDKTVSYSEVVEYLERIQAKDKDL